MLYILVTFYVTMAAAGYIVEILFGALGIIPSNRTVTVINQGPIWDYTSVLNIDFLVIAGILIARFLQTGGADMLRMMNVPEGELGHHVHPGQAAVTHDHGRM
jgi:hypothetical protein